MFQLIFIAFASMPRSFVLRPVGGLDFITLFGGGIITIIDAVHHIEALLAIIAAGIDRNFFISIRTADLPTGLLITN